MNTINRTTNTIKSLTLKFSLAEGVSIEDVRGKQWRLTVPLNALAFDHHNGADAWFYALLPLEIGNGATPAPAGLTLRDTGKHVRSGNDSGAPRESIVSRLVFDLHIAADATTFENIPLIAKGFAVATDAPASFTLPGFTATPDAPFTFTDIDGGALALGFAFEEIEEASDGASAYEIAVENGFEGDEAAWLASLQGADGADGAPGADGADSIFTEIASQGEAEAGADNAKGMTPLRTAQAIAALASGGGSVDEKILRYRSYRYGN